MLSDDTRINTQSFGAPSKVDSNRKRKVSSIAKYGTSSRRYSQLFHSLGTYFEHQNIWELGTSLGINTLYLASIPNANVVTFEGCGETLELAKKNFSRFEKKNITLIEGNLDETLFNELGKTRELDLVFFDANHRYDPTLRYFEACSTKSHASSLFIFDDIHWSVEMKSAWQEIIRHPMSRITIDLFQVGLVFLDPELPQQHYILEY